MIKQYYTYCKKKQRKGKCAIEENGHSFIESFHSAGARINIVIFFIYKKKHCNII
jgi:hypothetical protein